MFEKIIPGSKSIPRNRSNNKKIRLQPKELLGSNSLVHHKSADEMKAIYLALYLTPKLGSLESADGIGYHCKSEILSPKQSQINRLVGCEKEGSVSF